MMQALAGFPQCMCNTYLQVVECTLVAQLRG
jgi:hypothetical protein